MSSACERFPADRRIGEARTFHGGHDWLAEHGVDVVVLDDEECVRMMSEFVERNPQLWNEDIGR